MEEEEEDIPSTPHCHLHTLGPRLRYFFRRAMSKQDQLDNLIPHSPNSP